MHIKYFIDAQFKAISGVSIDNHTIWHRVHVCADRYFIDKYSNTEIIF